MRRRTRSGAGTPAGAYRCDVCRPTLESVHDFLGSLNKISESAADMGKRGLDFCQCTSKRMAQLTQVGLGRLLTGFQAWLQDASRPVDPRHLEQMGATLPEAAAEGLKVVAGFAAAAENPQIFQQLCECYVQVREEHLRRSLEGTFAGLQERLASSSFTGYQKGTHPYLEALGLVRRMLQEEERFALQVMPTTDVVARIVRRTADEWLTATQGICGALGRALDRGEYADHLYVFDLVERFAQAEDAGALRGALKGLTNAARVFLEKLRQDMETEGRQGSALPTPTNSTVFEQTSSLLNCLRRMVEYSAVVEAVLGSDASRDICVAELDYYGRMSAYYTEVLRWLETALDVRAKTYRKPLGSLVFRLNNYRYIQRAYTSSHIGALLPAASEEHYREVVQQLRDQFVAAWRAVACILVPSESGRSASGQIGPLTTPKDRFKIFWTEFDDAVKLQAGLSMPDAEFRFSLREQVKKMVGDAYDAFAAANQTVVLASQAKGTRCDADFVAEQMSRILSG